MGSCIAQWGYFVRMYLKRMNDHTVRLLTHGLEPLCAMSWFHGGRNRNDRLRERGYCP